MYITNRSQHKLKKDYLNNYKDLHLQNIASQQWLKKQLQLISIDGLKCPSKIVAHGLSDKIVVRCMIQQADIAILKLQNHHAIMENVLIISNNSKIQDASQIIPDKKITSIKITKCQQFQNVQHLEHMSHLKSLTINNCYALHEFHILPNQQLEDLDLRFNNIHTILPFSHVEEHRKEIFMQELNNFYYTTQQRNEVSIYQTKQNKLQNSQISYSLSIVSMRNYCIRKVDISGNKYLTCIEGLAQLSYIQELCLENCMINSLNTIIQLKKLIYLNINGTRITQYDGLSCLSDLQILLCANIRSKLSEEQVKVLINEINEIPNLININIAGNSLRSISSLQVNKIQSINLSNNHLINLTEIQMYVESNQQLKHLDISDNRSLSGDLNLQNARQLEYIGNNNNSVILHGISHIQHLQMARNIIATNLCSDIISLNISNVNVTDQQLNLLLQRMSNLQRLDMTTCQYICDITSLNNLYALKRLIIDNNPQLDMNLIPKLKLNTLNSLSIRHCNLKSLEFLQYPSFYLLEYLNISLNDSIALDPMQLIYLLYLQQLKHIACIQKFGQIKIRQYLVYFVCSTVNEIAIFQNHIFTLQQLKKINFKHQNKAIQKLRLPDRYKAIFNEIFINLSKQNQQQSFLNLFNKKTKYNFNYIPKSEQYKVIRVGKLLYKIQVHNIDLSNPLIYKNKYTKHDINFYSDMSYRNKHFIVEINNNSTFTSSSPLYQLQNLQELHAINCQNLYEPFDKYMHLMFTQPQKIPQNILFIESLVTLNLHGSKVRLETFIFIICTFKQLKNLDVSSNQLDYYKLQSMDKHFFNKLIKRLLSLNGPQKSNVTKIPKYLTCNINHLRQLQTFNVSDNCNMQLELIADELQGLRHIDVSNTNLQLLKLNADQKITKINLSRNNSLIYDAINILLFRQLKVLDLSHIQQIDQSKLNDIIIDDNDKPYCNDKLQILLLNNINCCPQFLHYFSTLTELHMKSIGTQNIQQITELIYHNIHLQILNISCNGLKLDILDLSFLLHLKDLNISENKIKYLKINKQTLESLNISNNPNFDFLVLLDLKKLHTLICKNIDLTKKHEIIIYNRFNLQTNKIEKEIKHILTSFQIIKHLTQLETLIMSFCNVSQDKMKSYEFRSLLNLKTLELDHSTFNFRLKDEPSNVQETSQDQKEGSINTQPEKVKRLNINTIFLSRSIVQLNLSKLGLRTFNNVIQHCYNLEVLDISWNNLQNVQELYCLKNLKFLRELYMQGNKFYKEKKYENQQRDNSNEDKFNDKPVENNKMIFQDLFNTTSESKSSFLKILFYSITIYIKKLFFDHNQFVLVLNEEIMLSIKDMVQNIYFDASGLVNDPYYITAYKQHYKSQ